MHHADLHGTKATSWQVAWCHMTKIIQQTAIRPWASSPALPALSLSLAASIVAITTAIAATSCARLCDCNVLRPLLAAPVIVAEVECHLAPNNHVFGTAVRELREMHENITLSVVSLNEAETLAIHELLEGAGIRHVGG